MNNNINEDLKDLNIEDFIWILFIIIALVAIYSDNLEREFLYTRNIDIYKKFHTINIILLIITFCVYLFYTIDNYEELVDLRNYGNISDVEKKELVLIMNILFLIGGAIAIYLEAKALSNTKL
jgi:Ca2+/Na+ antiporter